MRQMTKHQALTITPLPQDSELCELQAMLSRCMQCGTCTASCPNAQAMDLTPRQLWRLVQLGQLDRIFESRTFWMCSSCYTCWLRCPRDVEPTRAMAALKRLAGEHDRASRRKSAFYRAFAGNIRRYGRVQETALMSSYLTSLASPRRALEFTPIGMKMLGKGKLHPPSRAFAGRLELLFRKVDEMEERT
ncbi:4Fe-4S dicluster domain-containing protein [Oceanidesulfovibrio marinus]|nr:4Fe-4S dicluster domain-containing protein [Oceanidesulfovibrio marinus]